MKKIKCLFLTGLLALAFAQACSTPQSYKWETPHSTYEIGSFLDSKQATELRNKTGEKGFDSRIETGVIDGRLNYIVVVDLYGSKEEVKASLDKIGMPNAKFLK